MKYPRRDFILTLFGTLFLAKENLMTDEKKKRGPGRPKNPKKATDKKDQSDFLSVIHEGKRTQLPISAIKEAEILDATQLEQKYMGYTGIQVNESTYYIRPNHFENFVMKQGGLPKDTNDIREKVLASLRDLKIAWVKFGTAVLLVNNGRMFHSWGYETFKGYCEKELEMKQSAVYEIMKTTRFLMQNQRETYNRLMGGEKKALIPSYRSVYLLLRKKKQLEKEKMFDALLQELLQGKYSTREVSEKISDVLGENKEEISAPIKILNHYRRVCEEMEDASIPKNILQEALAVLDKMEKAVK